MPINSQKNKHIDGKKLKSSILLIFQIASEIMFYYDNFIHIDHDTLLILTLTTFPLPNFCKLLPFLF